MHVLFIFPTKGTGMVFFFFLISWHLSTAYRMPGTVLSALHVLSHLILIVTLQGFPLCRAKETAP